MRTRNWLIVSVVGCALLLSSARSFAAPVTGQVFQASVSLTGMSVSDSGGRTQIVKQVISAQNIINLALATPPTASVPISTVLALIVAPDSGEAAVIVLNTNTMENLATIAVFNTDGVSAKGKGTAVFAGLVAPVALGNDTNGISGGFLAISGSTAMTTNGAVKSFKGSGIIGSIQGAAFGSDFDAVINKGKFSTVQELPFSLPVPESP